MKIERQSVTEASGQEFVFVKYTRKEFDQIHHDWPKCHCGQPMEYANPGKNPLCKKHTDKKLKG